MSNNTCEAQLADGSEIRDEPRSAPPPNPGTLPVKSSLKARLD